MDTADSTTNEHPTTHHEQPWGDNPAMLLWRWLASLKLTVVLLALLMVLVMAGTLAQDKYDIWHVVNDSYFRVWIAKIDFQVFATLLGVFRPNALEIGGAFPFPGGYLIGTLMAINLLAAHTIRYKVRASGGRLLAGVFVLALGSLVTWMVIARALDSAYEASLTPSFSASLWNLCRGVYAGVVLGATYLLTLAWGKIRKPEWFALAGLMIVLLTVAVFLFVNPEWRIPDAGMRIVWQGIQAGGAGALLLASLLLLFGKRAGVILLHIGIAMLMGHEFYVGQTNVEAKMIIPEGGSTNWVFDDREAELALIDRSDADTDHVTVIPGKLLVKAAQADADSDERVIRDEQLPVDVKLVEYYPNCTISARGPPEEGSPLRGAARTINAKPIETNTQQNFSAAYVELLDKKSGDSLGEYLVTLWFDKEPAMTYRPMVEGLTGFPMGSGEQVVEGTDAPLSIAYRYKRIYKSYDVFLNDFSFDKFAGTMKAKNYSANVTLNDHESGSKIDFLIYMNNPLRYRGETFYQTGFDQWTEESTVLQVVENEGWMVPYIACAAVAVGMLVHFGVALLRFLDRRLRELNQAKQSAGGNQGPGLLSPEWAVPVLVGLLVAGYVASKCRPEAPKANGTSLATVATLPVLDEGRVKPFDTVARNMLLWYCQRQEAVVALDKKYQETTSKKLSDLSGPKRISATQWLLDVVAGKPEASDYYVFRVDNPELLSTLELKPRPGFYRYSISELVENVDKLIEQARLADQQDPKLRNLFQNEVLELMNKMVAYRRVQSAYSMPGFGDPEGDREIMQMLRGDDKIRAVVPDAVDGQWNTLFEGVIEMFGSLQEGRPAKGIAAKPLASAMLSWHDGQQADFLEAVSAYHNMAADYEAKLNDPANASFVSKLKTVEKLDTNRIEFETWFNAVSPFYYSFVLYLIAFLLSAASWLVWPKILGRSAIAIIAVTLVFHTLAIASRIYISDRPPITNLYTTAICIGWAMVLLMLVIESIFKLGFGSFVASGVGFTTLLIAHNLGLDEDTFTVVQAVLDTQFWLTTHVITINIGYAATMLAGCFGMVYIVGVQVLNLFSQKERRQIYAMMYGTLCFAILTSFVGTVLGGLWADDSWGRFWGWDPEENGAMLIVLWNAIALHARWDKMVGARGLAMLTIVGNVVTAWSWFGVNQLGIGLHNYGFDPHLAKYLLWFIFSQLFLLVVGAMPWHLPAGGLGGESRSPK